MDLDKIQVLKGRMCGIVSKMKCSENEKALAILDIGDTIDLLDQAESDFWDLEGYLADIEDQDNEIDDLKEKNKKLTSLNEILQNKMDDVFEIADSLREIAKEVIDEQD